MDLQSLKAAGRGEDLVALLLQYGAEHQQVILLVVHDQYGFHGYASLSGGRTGRLTVTRAPRGSRLAIPMLPP